MSGDLKPYPAYRESGISWLGQIPEHWGARRLKYLLREQDSRSDDGSEQLLRVSQYTGVTRRTRMDGLDGPDTRAESLVGYKRVQPEDLVVNIMLAWNGSMGVARYSGIVSPAYCVYRFGIKPQPWYFHYLLRSAVYKARIKAVSTGVVESRLRLYTDDLYRLEAILPPPSEQVAIVRFLEHADRRIRRYILAKQKLIQLLEEQKQAIIHDVVTHGLSPNPRLKPTGIEWLRDVPEHWEIRKLRHCGKMQGGMTPSMEARRFWGGDIPWVTPKDMKTIEIRNSGLRVADVALKETSLRQIDVGAVLLVVRGMILARRVPVGFTTATVTVNQDMKAIVPRPEIDGKFLAYQLSSAQQAFKPLIDEAGHGTRRLPTERLRELSVVLPPRDEQLLIGDFIDSALRHVNSAIESATREIELFNEYRDRLIVDLVTGKLDVREATSGLPDEAEGSDEFEDGALVGGDDTALSSDELADEEMVG